MWFPFVCVCACVNCWYSLISWHSNRIPIVTFNQRFNFWAVDISWTTNLGIGIWTSERLPLVRLWGRSRNMNPSDWLEIMRIYQFLALTTISSKIKDIFVFLHRMRMLEFSFILYRTLFGTCSFDAEKFEHTHPLFVPLKKISKLLFYNLCI